MKVVKVGLAPGGESRNVPVMTPVEGVTVSLSLSLAGLVTLKVLAGLRVTSLTSVVAPVDLKDATGVCGCYGKKSESHGQEAAGFENGICHEKMRPASLLLAPGGKDNLHAGSAHYHFAS